MTGGATEGDEEQTAMVLTDNEKHRVIQKFVPALRGHLLEGANLEGFFSDAVSRARNKGWSDEEIQQAAKTGKWRRSRTLSSDTFG